MLFLMEMENTRMEKDESISKEELAKHTALLTALKLKWHYTHKKLKEEAAKKLTTQSKMSTEIQALVNLNAFVYRELPDPKSTDGIRKAKVLKKIDNLSEFWKYFISLTVYDDDKIYNYHNCVSNYRDHNQYDAIEIFPLTSPANKMFLCDIVDIAFPDKICNNEDQKIDIYLLGDMMRYAIQKDSKILFDKAFGKVYPAVLEIAYDEYLIYLCTAIKYKNAYACTKLLNKSKLTQELLAKVATAAIKSNDAEALDGVFKMGLSSGYLNSTEYGDLLHRHTYKASEHVEYCDGRRSYEIGDYSKLECKAVLAQYNVWRRFKNMTTWEKWHDIRYQNHVAVVNALAFSFIGGWVLSMGVPITYGLILLFDSLLMKNYCSIEALLMIYSVTSLASYFVVLEPFCGSDLRYCMRNYANSIVTATENAICQINGCLSDALRGVKEEYNEKDIGLYCVE